MTGRPLLAELVEAVADAAVAQDQALPLVVEQIAVSTPVELGLRVQDGRVTAVEATPPTQTLETSVLPVWHRLSVRVVAS